MHRHRGWEKQGFGIAILVGTGNRFSRDEAIPAGNWRDCAMTSGSGKNMDCLTGPCGYRNPPLPGDGFPV